jgi:hypothetical protein
MSALSIPNAQFGHNGFLQPSQKEDAIFSWQNDVFMSRF